MSRRPVRVGALFLLNAGNKGDEGIFLAFCERMSRDPRFASGAWRVQVGGVGPSGFEAHDLPPDRAGQERLGMHLFAPKAHARRAGIASILGALRGALAFSLRTDRVFFAGGHWIHDLSLAKHLVICLWLAAMRALGARTGVFCVGSGPIRRPFARALTRAAFGRDSILYFRDPGSQKLFHELGRPQAAVGDDLAMLFAHDLRAQAATAPRRMLGVSPCAWGKLDNIYARDGGLERQVREELETLTSRAREAGWTIAWIPTMNPEDLDFARGLARAGDEVWDTATVPARELVRRMSSSLGAMVSMRLHPAVFAWGLGVPFSALAYAPKVSAFMARVGLQDKCVGMDRPGWGEASWQAAASAARDAERARGTISDAEIASRLEGAYADLGRWIDA